MRWLVGIIALRSLQVRMCVNSYDKPKVIITAVSPESFASLRRRVTFL